MATETGRIMDDFTVKKVPSYKPDLAARNAFLYSGYQPNYAPTFLEASFTWQTASPLITHAAA